MVDIKNYIFTNVLTHVRPFAKQLSAQSNATHVATGEITQPTTALSVNDHAIKMAPGIIDWDDTQFNATRDPVIDYREDDAMDMAGYTQPHE
ncbi:hypothetical protein F5050DRAFT_1813123 [Lentinula boryana]|uniref:Uncharacterized protein n=1 Tax=Lentinula boryana TaxID=40481 RepID=A0ABQ8PXI5_9AGAR|nr:hypothetical protein F5050DRAFT_1813123 [Lentinula boryana]